ncbi:hypothetical protein [Phenylobacterium sp.]|uniref:hypothetical protein n=1 Tax=Phenylobacterium sp. TaxID=1871053 RepID=UPI00272EF0CF|nr:hypothetical protein [Phenylobacterium sp.]MDP1872883.1 hypothetical protein [Phenylobacterium sp.]MDP3298959.1 hypothetical protein [Phenylobacterium sp.]MDP3490219.1 hypothetical protein [Phenylobacterium sp.]
MTEQRKDDDANAPSSRPAAPLPEGQKHDQLDRDGRKAESRQEALVDEAVEETFPASDPIAPKHIT